MSQILLFTREKLETTASRLQEKKAPGPDGQKLLMQQHETMGTYVSSQNISRKSKKPQEK